MRTVLEQELSRLNQQSDRQYTSFQTEEQTAHFL
jgi:hypothetical protein